MTPRSVQVLDGAAVVLPSRQAFAEGHRVYEPPWPERHSHQAVFGHPRAAASTRGQLIIDAAVAGLAQLVRELRADLVAG